MPIPKIKDSERWSTFIQPVIMLAVDYCSILLAECVAIEFREFILQTLGHTHDKFDLDSFYFFLFVPLIFIVFLHWGRTYIRLLSIGEMIRRTFWSVLYSVVVYIVILF